MKFEIPKVTRFLPLQGYAPDEPALAGVGIQVWVDPPRSVLMEFDALNRAFGLLLNKLTTKQSDKKPKKPAERLVNWIHLAVKKSKDSGFKSETDSYRRSLYGWYARLWSQNPDAETHWTVDELEKVNDENPRLYEWLCISSWSLIEQHRDDVKKGYRGPSAKLPAADAPATPS